MYLLYCMHVCLSGSAPSRHFPSDPGGGAVVCIALLDEIKSGSTYFIVRLLVILNPWRSPDVHPHWTTSDVAVCLPASAQLFPAKAFYPFLVCFWFFVRNMSDYGALSTNGVGAGMKKDAFADAVQRARQVTSIRPRLESTGETSS